MEELAAQRPEISFRAAGDPPETYQLLFSLPGLTRDATGTLHIRNLHRCTAYLHRDYPRRPPVFSWLTPIFHPNILAPDRNGGVCLGSWSAGESLADVVRRLSDLVAYRSFNAADALNRDAASWALERGLVAPVDLARLVAADCQADSDEVRITIGRQK
jgi:ubiquitin-protein ligase